MIQNKSKYYNRDKNDVNFKSTLDYLDFLPEIGKVLLFGPSIKSSRGLTKKNRKA